MEITCGFEGTHPIYVKYHEEEWGKPEHDENKLFELLILESAQAGLSWITILKKRENYRLSFDNFDPNIIQDYDEDKFLELMDNPCIIRNKLKIRAAINNAIEFINIQNEFGSFNNYIWSFTDNKVIVNNHDDFSKTQSSSELSDKLSKDLKKRGFKFLGTTTCYAYLQAIGVINDHIRECTFKY